MEATFATKKPAAFATEKPMGYHWQLVQASVTVQVQSISLDACSWPLMSCVCLGLALPAMHLHTTSLVFISILYYHVHTCGIGQV